MYCVPTLKLNKMLCVQVYSCSKLPPPSAGLLKWRCMAIVAIAIAQKAKFITVNYVPLTFLLQNWHFQILSLGKPFAIKMVLCASVILDYKYQGWSYYHAQKQDQSIYVNFSIICGHYWLRAFSWIKIINWLKFYF